MKISCVSLANQKLYSGKSLNKVSRQDTPAQQPAQQDVNFKGWKSAVSAGTWGFLSGGIFGPAVAAICGILGILLGSYLNEKDVENSTH